MPNTHTGLVSSQNKDTEAPGRKKLVFIRGAVLATLPKRDAIYEDRHCVDLQIIRLYMFAKHSSQCSCLCVWACAPECVCVNKPSPGTLCQLVFKIGMPLLSWRKASRWAGKKFVLPLSLLLRWGTHRKTQHTTMCARFISRLNCLRHERLLALGINYWRCSAVFLQLSN